MTGSSDADPVGVITLAPDRIGRICAIAVREVDEGLMRTD
jgi:hypothetical protein